MTKEKRHDVLRPRKEGDQKKRKKKRKKNGQKKMKERKDGDQKKEASFWHFRAKTLWWRKKSKSRLSARLDLASPW